MQIFFKKTKFILLFSLIYLLLSTQISNADVPIFIIDHDGAKYECSEYLINTQNTDSNLVSYRCRKELIANKEAKESTDVRGQAESDRFINDIKANEETHIISIRKIPSETNATIAKNISRALALEKKPVGKAVNRLLPPKLYLSLRYQLINESNKLNLADGGTRGGFFYYYKINDDMNMMFQYETSIDLFDDIPFLNASDNAQSGNDWPALQRRLSYLSIGNQDLTLLYGKYWSVYYDIAGMTDKFIAFGAHASGAFHDNTDGGYSGTGRADNMIQFRIKKDKCNLGVQYQFKNSAPDDLDSSYKYGVGVSLQYNIGSGINAGGAFNYARFDDITLDMRSIGIKGNDQSYIGGISYREGKISSDMTLSYTKNHMNDDEGNYFNALGTELYLRYDIRDNLRLAGGINWLIPKDSDYQGNYSIEDAIVSLQYTFGEMNYNDLVYVELRLPQGKLANGDDQKISISIGARYLLDR